MNFQQVRTEIEFVAVRSRGPGGQNVNKVSSAACLYWSYLFSTGLSEFEKQKVAEKMRSWINKENQVYIRSDEFRDLEQNKSRCLEKLESMLIQAFHRPKIRKATKPTRASKERKLEAKARRGKIKALRQKGDW